MPPVSDIPALLALLQPVLDSARQGMIVVRPDGMILAANRASAVFNGVPQVALVGTPLGRSPCWGGSPSTAELIKLDLSRAAHGEATRREVVCGAGPSQRVIELSISPVAAPGGGPPQLLVVEGHDITVHRRLATMLEESNARHEAILASTLDPMITIDAYGTIQAASRSVERVLGYRPDEVIGRNINILMPEPHRSGHDGYLANYRRTGVTNILNRAREFEALRKDGTLVPIELSVSRVDVPGQLQPLFTGIIKDISERKRADAEIRLLQSLTQSISEARGLPYAMESSLRLIGEATRWDFGEVWLPTAEPGVWYCGKFWIRDGLPLADMRVPPEKKIRIADSLPGLIFDAGKAIWIRELGGPEGPGFIRAPIAARLGMHTAAGIPILADGEPVALIVFFLRGQQREDQRLLGLLSAAVSPLGNLIRRKHAENELELSHQRLEDQVRERTAQLESTHEQLRTADRLASIGTLAAGLGHDMSNVLLPVRCRLDAMDAERLPAEFREQFHAVRKSVDYLQQLSDGLHLLSLDPEDMEASTETTDLPAWWEQVGNLLRKSLPKAAALEVHIPADLPKVVVAPHRLTQAVLNVMVNSAEAIPASGGRVRFGAEAIDGGAGVRIRITDNGRGMTDEVRRRAMDPFFTTKKRGLGTGLGLSLVRGVAQAAGGSVAIESAPGRGTTIELVFSTPRPPSEDARALTASVSIRDARTATMIEAMFQSAGFATQRCPADEPAVTSIWALEPSEAALAAAKRYMREGSRRQLVVVGEAPAAWRRLGAIVVDEPESFEDIRRGVGEAVLALDGEGV